MNYQSTITKKGQITVPKNLRNFLGLKTHSKVSFAPLKNKKEVKIKKEPDILDLAGKFKSKKSAISAREVFEKKYKRI